MSLSKRCFFTVLAMIVAIAAVRKLDVRCTGFDVLARNSRPSGPTLLPDKDRRYVGEPANQPVRLLDAHHSKSEIPLLPAQSKNPEDLGVGKLLVASRNLADPIFAKTVVLLIHYDAEGVVGLVLNRRTDIPLSRAFEQLKGAKDRSDPVYLGGPVELPAVFALLRSPAKLEGAEHILGELYLISSKTAFEKAISSRPDPGAFHVYFGYAGWTKDQIRKEVELGAWFIFQADTRTVFDRDPDSLWRQMIQKTELKLAGSEPADASRSTAYKKKPRFCW